MSRRRPAALPPSPFKMGETVKFRTRDDVEHVGTISLVGWLPFPGMYSFEIKTADGASFSAPGTIKEIEKADPAPAAAAEAMIALRPFAEVLGGSPAPAAAPVIEQTEAGPQVVIPGSPARTVPDSKLKAKKCQTERLTALELGAIENKQAKLF